MATAIVMPRLGMSMQEGRVVSWPIALGGRVERGETLLVIESEKAEVEIEATLPGVLRHVYVAPDKTVPCGTLLGAITDTTDEVFDAVAFARAHERPRPVAASPGAPPAPLAAPPRGAAGAVRAPVAPAARARARALGIDPEQVPGSGPGGRVTREDVEAWAERRRALVEVAPGVALEVPVQGAGEPVLLLPGFGTDVAVFARQVPLLAATHRVLGVNPRGVGRSDAPADACYGVAQAAADAAAAAGGPAHVIGASLGAAVAIEMALAHPERVRSLVLVTPFVEAGARLLAVVDAWCRIARDAGPEALGLALLPWLFGPDTLADAAARARTVRGLAQIAARVPAATLERQAAGLRAWSGTRSAALAHVAVPVLVVAGGEDLLTPDVALVAQAIPGAKLLSAARAGHAVALEAADVVADALRAHLASTG